MDPRRMAGLTIALLVLAACGSGSGSGSAKRSSDLDALQAAAKATASAKSFSAQLVPADVQISYQAPDRYAQIEHGHAQSASSDAPTPVTYDETLTKVFIGDRLYEADTREGETDSYSASARCTGEQTTAEALLAILRAIAVSHDIHRSGDRYAFAIPKGEGVLVATSGTATIEAGFVVGLSIGGGSPVPETFTIGSINSAPPVTAPLSYDTATVECDSG